MGKKILAVIIGLIIGGLVIMGIEAINMLRFPWPEGMSMDDKEGFVSYMQSLPMSALITVLMAHIVGAIVAGFTSTKIAAVNNINLGLICGVILLIGAAINLFMIPHPIWFMVINVLTILPAALLGAKLAIKK
ncbi:hypothetical protein [Kangiella sp. HZ709]|uniref:hypothetical protein n=1 Tax=Kangiella sp. HZ709 TaxID=2666328 RepID=UPI0012AFF871|nr:hypothetical protein [Kangiella sp. HZ709]MRX27733.1 hypothetical protein [Kangiella sp. HZ709]